MLALLSSPLRRWLLATLLLPVVGYLLAKIGLYLQRRNLRSGFKSHVGSCAGLGPTLQLPATGGNAYRN